MRSVFTENEHDPHSAQLLGIDGGMNENVNVNDKGYLTNTAIISDEEPYYSSQQAVQMKNDLDAMFQSNPSDGILHSGNGALGQYAANNAHQHQAASAADHSQHQLSSVPGAYHPSYVFEPYSTSVSSAPAYKDSFNAAFNGTNESSNTYDGGVSRTDKNNNEFTSDLQHHLITPPCPSPLDAFQPHSGSQGGSNKGVVGGGNGNQQHSMQSEFQHQSPFATYYTQDFSDLSNLQTSYSLPSYYPSNQQYYQPWEKRGSERSAQDNFGTQKQPDYHGSNSDSYSQFGATSNKRSLQLHAGGEGQVHRRKPPRKRVKRSDDMPRYPLSAYNFFFSEEREVALALLSAPPEDYETVPDATTPCSNDNSDSSVPQDSKERKASQNELPTFKNQDEEYAYIQGILSTRKMSESKMEELRAKIKANTQKKLNTLFEGDKVKKSHKKSHGKITFQVLSRLIGQRWRDITNADVKQYYFDLAKKDQERYNAQMKEYKKLGKAQN